MTTPDPRTARAILTRAAYALERIAHALDAANDQTRAPVVPIAYIRETMDAAANELAHHADAIRHASGLEADTAANLAAIARNPSTR